MQGSAGSAAIEAPRRHPWQFRCVDKAVVDTVVLSNLSAFMRGRYFGISGPDVVVDHHSPYFVFSSHLLLDFAALLQLRIEFRV